MITCPALAPNKALINLQMAAPATALRTGHGQRVSLFPGVLVEAMGGTTWWPLRGLDGLEKSCCQMHHCICTLLPICSSILESQCLLLSPLALGKVKDNPNFLLLWERWGTSSLKCKKCKENNSSEDHCK